MKSPAKYKLDALSENVDNVDSFIQDMPMSEGDVGIRTGLLYELVREVAAWRALFYVDEDALPIP